MAASDGGHPTVVKILLQAGATVNPTEQVDALAMCEAYTKYQLTLLLPHVAMGVCLVL